MIESLKQFGKTYYHPILDNYPQYKSFKEQENVIKEINSSQSLAFTQGIEVGKTNYKLFKVFVYVQNEFVLAFHQCKKPCVNIEYTIEKDSYLLGTPDENAINSGCQAGEGVISIQFSKNWEYAKVKFVLYLIGCLNAAL